jgi:hypothetical protein
MKVEPICNLPILQRLPGGAGTSMPMRKKKQMRLSFGTRICLARKFLFFRAEPTKKLPESPDSKALVAGNSGDSGDFLTGRESKCEYFSRQPPWGTSRKSMNVLILPSFR